MKRWCSRLFPIGILLLIVGILLALGKFQQFRQNKQDDQFVEKCKFEADKQLIAPSTASYQWKIKKYSHNNTYDIYFYVDSQNRLGGTVRMGGICHMNGDATIRDVKVGEDYRELVDIFMKE